MHDTHDPPSVLCCFAPGGEVYSPNMGAPCTMHTISHQFFVTLSLGERSTPEMGTPCTIHMIPHQFFVAYSPDIGAPCTMHTTPRQGTNGGLIPSVPQRFVLGGQVYSPDMGAPCTMHTIPRRFLAAFPSGERSMPRCRAIAAETGVTSSSPTPAALPFSFTLSTTKRAIKWGEESSVTVRG